MWTHSRRCGSANVERSGWTIMAAINLLQVLHDAWTQHRQRERELDYDGGTGGEHIARCVRKMRKEGV